MSGIAVITEACLDVNHHACVDVCPVHCIYELDVHANRLIAEVEAGSGQLAGSHAPAPEPISVFGGAILYVNPDECTSCGACYQPDVCPGGAIYAEDRLPDGRAGSHYNPRDRSAGHDHTFFATLDRDVFAD